MQKKLFNDNHPNHDDVINKLINQLPSVPTSIRYLDDFDKRVRTIQEFNTASECIFHVNGSPEKVNFEKYHEKVSVLIKLLIVEWVSKGLGPATISLYCAALYKVEYNDFCLIINAGPLNILDIWTNLITDESMRNNTLNALKALLFLLAKYELWGWSTSYDEFISKNLILRFNDKFAGVKRGDVFITATEESKIVNYIDGVAASIKTNLNEMSFEYLANAGILISVYQFGMRPVQIALLTMRDIRIWNNLADEVTNVHLSFKMVKQSSKSKSHVMLRKVKKEWGIIFEELYKKNLTDGMSGADRLFRVNSANKMSIIINKSVSKIIGRKAGSTNMRHTGAQRMVDGGASQEELAEFMGHTDITTGLVYFQTSANQAERVNQALGISPIYQQMVKIAHDKFISQDELAELKGTYQIAAVPHGIPIAGIGACSSGQPSCPFNPVTSCYGCRKFMPLQEVFIHEQVLKDIREIIIFFNNESKGDLTSPTYLQLQNTISGVQQIIAEIESGGYA